MPDTETVSFTVKGQVVIPRRIRREFEIETGTKAVVQSTPEGILLKPITGAAIKRALDDCLCASLDFKLPANPARTKSKVYCTRPQRVTSRSI